MTFTEYCTSENIKLQPQDLIFLKKQLKTIPTAYHKAVVRRYCKIWVTTRDATESPIEARSTNAGRYAANTWIRGIASGEQVLDGQV